MVVNKIETEQERRKWTEETKKEYDIIHDKFLQEFEKLSKLDVYRPTILIGHLYADFFLAQIFKAIPIYSMSPSSDKEEDYEFLERVSLFVKTNFLNMMIPSEEQDFKNDVIKGLLELNANRNRIAHNFEVDTLKLNGKDVMITTENVRKINENVKTLIKKLHKALYDILAIDILTEDGTKR